MVVTGPSGSGNSFWTKQLLLSNHIHPPAQRIIWCYGQWQLLYEDLQREFPTIQFTRGIPDHLTDTEYIDGTQRTVIVFDDLMTEAKCDPRIADLFTKGSHHRNISVVYLTQNVFPQGKACRDIALNTQYLILFNNPIDRQQVATLARRIYPSNSHSFMKQFEEAVRKPYGYLLVDLKAQTPEFERLKTDIFSSQYETDREKPPAPIEQNITNDENMWRTKRSYGEEDSDTESIAEEGDDSISIISKPRIGPPGKRRKTEIEETRKYDSVWQRRFKEPLRQAHLGQFSAKINEYTENGERLDTAVHRAANDELPLLRKMLRQNYAQFLVDFYTLQTDLRQQLILQSAKNLRNQHDMTVAESIKQAVKLRKDLFREIWPDHVIHEDTSQPYYTKEDEEDNAHEETT